MNHSASCIRWLKDISMNDLPLVGGKTASLGEMYRSLTERQIRVPNGFGITADAYRLFLEKNQLQPLIESELKVGLSNADQLQTAGKRIRDAMVGGELPDGLEEQIVDAYRELTRDKSDRAVAVRSSATAEDLPGASFAGQQETYLNVRTEETLISACKQCFASLFTDRAITYRRDMGFDHFAVALSVCVQLMVRSDLASSGVMFSIDTESGFRDAILINSSYGLGENIVKGTVNPDEFLVFKPTLRSHSAPILRKRKGSKEWKLIYETGNGKTVRNVPVPPEDKKAFSVNTEEILQLARWACDIEEHYSKLNGAHTPMDMEWAKDGLSGELWILQARPETVQARRSASQFTFFSLEEKGQALVEGRSVGEKIGQGKVRVVHDPAQLGDVQEGEVLVTDRTDPDWEPTMRKVKAIVTNRGGRTCHAAIVSRELGIPAIVGTERGTDLLRNGQDVTVSCAEGEVGRVYEGLLRFEEKTVDITEFSNRPKTRIMMNLGNPDEAFRLSFLPNDGVGLARIEFIIAGHIKVHPLALLDFQSVQDSSVREAIETLTEGYASKADYFVDKLSQGVGVIAAAFYPKDVIVRFSDFKSNEYARLLGGADFEPHEENPMIGFRGASRYYHERYRDAFALECQAIRKAREEMGLTNVKVMIPFCRTLEEGRNVLKAMESAGLAQGRKGLEVYMMCEVPSNVILAEEFADIFDGFSIGSNDLTQLVLGVDRDSEILFKLFDERNEAVMRTICHVIRVARRKGCKIGICGQAPSDYPEVAERLVMEGIDSLSLNPDSLLKLTGHIRRIEEIRREEWAAAPHEDFPLSYRERPSFNPSV